MTATDRPLIWLHGEVKTPPFSPAARLEAGFLLRRLQQGELLGTPEAVIETCRQRLRSYDDA